MTHNTVYVKKSIMTFMTSWLLGLRCIKRQHFSPNFILSCFELILQILVIFLRQVYNIFKIYRLQSISPSKYISFSIYNFISLSFLEWLWLLEVDTKETRFWILQVFFRLHQMASWVYISWMTSDHMQHK